MEDQTSSIREKLLAALETSDESRRAARADRIEWLSQHRQRPGAIMGRAETLRLLDEAEDAFVDGHFVAALVLATCFLEHTLMEELQDRGMHKGVATLKVAITRASDNDLFPADWLNRLDAVRKKRNPFAHLSRADDPHTMGNRFREQKVHPLVMLEADAKDALELMQRFFIATLRPVT